MERHRGSLPHRLFTAHGPNRNQSTVLCSAGNDGRVRLWKATMGNVWRAAGHISVEQAEEQGDTDVDMEGDP